MKNKNKTSVLYDHQIFSLQDYGGISRLFVELIKSFNKQGKCDPRLSLLFSNNSYLNEIDFNKTFLSNTKLPKKRLIIKNINKIYSILNLLYKDYDLFHPTYYDPYFLRFLGKKNFVLSIHDMTHEVYSEDFKSNDKTSLWKRELANKAKHIISISESTKKDIIKFLDIDESKITVVPLATSLQKTSQKLDIKLPNNYILYVGNRNGYKNFEVFLEAIVPLLKNEEDLYLVCAGGGNFKELELQRMKEYKIVNKVVYKDFTKNEELATYYQNAKLFVFPSLYEGFGIPVLEAMACECPLVLSNSSSLPEVALDSAIYFNANSKDSILNSVSKVYKDNNLRKKLIESGKIRIKDFSWEKTASLTAEVYKKSI